MADDIAVMRAELDAAWDRYLVSRLRSNDLLAFDPAADRLEALMTAVKAVDDAITIEGRHAYWHRKVMQQHRTEWPTLWAALDQLREVFRA